MKETSLWDNLIKRYSFNFLGIYCAETIIPILMLLPFKLLSQFVQNYFPNAVIFSNQDFGPINLASFIDNSIISNIALIPPYCLFSNLLAILFVLFIIIFYKLLKKRTINYYIISLIYIITLYIFLLILIVNTQINAILYPSSIGAVGIYIALIFYPLTLITLIIVPFILFLLELNKNFRIKNEYILKNKIYGRIIGISLYLSILAIIITLLTL